MNFDLISSKEFHLLAQLGFLSNTCHSFVPVNQPVGHSGQKAAEVITFTPHNHFAKEMQRILKTTKIMGVLLNDLAVVIS